MRSRVARSAPPVAPCTVWWAEPSEQPELEALLSADERLRAGRLRDRTTRSLFITGRALLRVVVAARLDRSPGEIRIQQHCMVCGSSEHGKPEVADADMAFSVTHGGDRIGVAIMDRWSVGIDVEPTTVSADPGHAALASIALSAEERSVYDGLPPDRRDWATVTWWTRKESVLKATGWGLAIPPDHVQVTAPDQPAAVLGWAPGDEPSVPVHLQELTPGPGHVAYLAVLGGEASVTEFDGNTTLRSTAVAWAREPLRGRW